MIKENNWKEEEYNDKNGKRKDEQALFYHFIKKHNNIITNNLKLTNAYEIIFLEKPQYTDLDIRENFWIGKLKSRINIARTIAPKYR